MKCNGGYKYFSTIRHICCLEIFLELFSDQLDCWNGYAWRWTQLDIFSDLYWADGLMLLYWQMITTLIECTARMGNLHHWKKILVVQVGTLHRSAVRMALLDLKLCELLPKSKFKKNCVDYDLHWAYYHFVIIFLFIWWIKCSEMSTLWC